MNQTLVKQEIRKMKFEELYTARTEHRLTVEQAAEILGVHERTFRRWTESYEENGAEGLLDKRIGKKPHNRAPVDEVVNVLNLFETQYRHFHLAHFHDRYRFDHGGTRSYGWIKKILQDAGVVRKAKKRNIDTVLPKQLLWCTNTPIMKWRYSMGLDVLLGITVKVNFYLN